jgi:transposase-like protein
MVARRWTAEQARAALQALESSGEPVTRFCARHGLDAHRVYGWRRRLKRGLVAAPTFVEIVAGETAREEGGFEVLLATGDRVRVPAVYDVASLGALVAILRGGRRC